LSVDLHSSITINSIKSTLKLLQGRFFILGTLIIHMLFACDSRKELLTQQVYEGPIMEMHDVNTMLSDSGRQAMRLKAPLQLDFDNGDKKYPEGLNLQYFGKSESVICTFESNTAYFEQAENLWTGEGNVQVQNLQNGDELTTELLHWNPAEEIFFTDRFVTIVSDGEIHTGEGLRANQDFTSYQILNPSGTINLREQF
jgi:LPS export ABC transporter protein LptC